MQVSRFKHLILIIFLILFKITNAQNKQTYSELIKTADEYFAKNEYYNAKNTYQLALNLDKNATYPKQKIEEIIRILNAEMEFRIRYEDKILEASRAYESKDFEKAISLYKEATHIISYEEKPKLEIIRIEKEWNELKLKKKNFEQLKSESLLFKQNKEFSKALAKMEEAKKLFPDSPEVKTEIDQLNYLLDQFNKQTAEFKSLVLEADKQLEMHRFQESLKNYKKAEAIFEDDNYVKKQIGIVNEALKREEKYNSIIERADKHYIAFEFDEAKNAYLEAQKVWGEKTYPVNMIAKLEEAKNRKASELEQMTIAYNGFINQAESFKTAKDYPSAINYYQKALEIFPAKELPKEQIAALNLLIKQENEYKRLINSGDEKFATGKLNDALFDYYQAKNIFPNATYPTKKIEEIDQLLLKLSEADKKYQAELKIADSLYQLKLWEEAIAQLEIVIGLKDSEPYPKNRLAQAKKFWEEQKILDAKYQQIIKKADALFERLAYTEAKIEYLEANRLKPNEPYPLYKIEDINTIQEQSDIRKVNTRYTELIASADKLFNEKTYPLALTQYKQASALKQNEIYPLQQIAKIEQILAALEAAENRYNKIIKLADSSFYLDNLLDARGSYILALELKPKESYPKTQIDKIDGLLLGQKELDRKYIEAILKADKGFAVKNYLIAKEDYLVALNLKPSEIYPKNKIAEIEKILNELNALDANYLKEIKEGDRNFTERQYIPAISNYQKASEIKPLEKYPIDQIAKINSILKEQDALDEQYKNVLAIADNYFGEKQFREALSPYQKASELKPAEKYPKDQIAKINTIFKEINDLNEAYKNNLAIADKYFFEKKYRDALIPYHKANELKPEEKYPIDQIAKINTILKELLALDESYKNFIGIADKFFSEKQYREALSPYQKASELKPEEKYPLDQISRIRDLLFSDNVEYQAFIKLGDEAFRMINYQDAIVAYENALGILPGEAYPKMMLEKIEGILRKESVLTLVSMPETIAGGIEKKYLFKPIDYRDRQNNYILIEMKNSSNSKIRVFINFGKDNLKNGGYIVNLVQREGYTKYFVRIDRNLRWQNEENNWISLLPDGGDLEINRILISRESKTGQ